MRAPMPNAIRRALCRSIGPLAPAVPVLAILGCLAAAGSAYAGPPAGQANFSTPRLYPAYSPQIHDYAVRCRNRAVAVSLHANEDWQAAIDDQPLQTGDQTVSVPLKAERRFTVSFARSGGQGVDHFFVRCLPTDFPTYTFSREGPVSPKFFTADDAFAQPLKRRYVIIFDNNGVPLWWYHLPAEGPRVLSDGTVLWFHSNGSASRYEIHRLNGTLVRALRTANGAGVDGHDVQPLPDGGYLIGARSHRSHVDTSAYGGSSDARVLDTELQEVSPRGKLVWRWRSQDHISLAATGRWWPFVIDHPAEYGYDISHWNSIEPHGNSVIASFRMLDAVYKINQASGAIAWKLGGTSTRKSLDVVGDPNHYPLGAQHDARLLSDGSLSVFDNRTALTDPAPRMVHYRINQQSGTATYLESISDPDVPESYCCGSARRVPNGDWLIDWGEGAQNGAGAIGGYRPDGQRTFLLSFHTTYSYRAQPVPPRALTRQQLRRGMNAICGPACR
jgi:Arylsulfotransferase (ASST)